MARSITDTFVAPDGTLQKRATGKDFDTLSVRVWDAINSTPGFEEGTEVVALVNLGCDFYEAGWYSRSYGMLRGAVERLPALAPHLAYYLFICHRVLSVPLSVEELEYEDRLNQWRYYPRWFRWRLGRMPQLMRCKWCGRYTPWVHPDTPTFGFSHSNNCCSHCMSPYPMPSWIWDSPDGRTYSYYRQSFQHEFFDKDFDRDFDPDPKVD